VSGSPARHLHAAERHESAAATHDRVAHFWEIRGNDGRARLHRDAAVHERAGAALERRWADLIEADERPRGAAEDDPPEATGAPIEAAVEGCAVEIEMRESGLLAPEPRAGDQDWPGDPRDGLADARDAAADRREWLADERQATAAARGLERLERARQREDRERAADEREQSAVDRQTTAAEAELPSDE
jgi:hypothetical protein